MLLSLCLLMETNLGPMPFLSPMFGSHMVLQRDRLNTFWGWSTPGSKVTVSVADHHAETTAAPDGKWIAKIDPPKAGGPYTVKIHGDQEATLEDVLVGDVWVCSGQSNMEMGIGMVNNAQAEIAAATNANLRIFMVTKATALKPQSLCTGSWSVCSPASIAQGGWGGFSAVGYFFGRDLQEKLKIPIGLVSTNWGGTVAEAWTSPTGLRHLNDFNPALDLIEGQNKPGTPSFSERFDQWSRENDPGSAANWQAESFDSSNWKTCNMPSKYEDIGLSAFDGIVWYRHEFQLPDPLPEGAQLLTTGDVDDIDSTWLNGQVVGATYSVSSYRQYKVKPGILKPGRNTIAIRVVDTGGIGGFGLGPDHMNVRIGGALYPLAGTWSYHEGAELKSSKPMPPTLDGNPNVPTVLYNGMIAPVAPLAIKGAIWYQGESNVGRAAQYAKLLPAMVTDWRRTWGQGDFPFFVVQLANFSDRHPNPVEDAWAELREAQSLSVRSLKNAGIAVTIDIGDGADIHPKNKQDVGKRLALSALHVAYGQKLEYSGPVLKAAKREGNALSVTFDHGTGLMAKGGKVLGFQIAGADKKFSWADAVIRGHALVVSSPAVPEPMYVRYAWDANPEANLYNGAGLPAEPFRTDGPGR